MKSIVIAALALLVVACLLWANRRVILDYADDLMLRY